MTIQKPDGVNRYMPQCGIVSICVFTGQNVNDCLKDFAKEFGKAPQWKGGTALSERLLFLKRKGFTVSIIKHNKETLKKWVLENSQPEKTYMITLGSHVVTVRNNTVVDQSEASNIFSSRNKQKRIRHICEVLK